MNVKQLSFRGLAVVSSLVIVGIAASSAASAAEPQTTSIHVQLGDLNLATPSGRQTAYERVHRAARAVCHRVSDADDLGQGIHVGECIKRTLAQANVSLAQLVARSEAIQLAGSPTR